MKEVLLTSSVLILALLALRRLFRKTISRRLQYALWGLVLLRLLIPASLPAADFSVLTAAAPVRQAVETTLETPRRYFNPVDTTPAKEFPHAETAEPGQPIQDYAGSFGYPVLSQDGSTVTTYATKLDKPFLWSDVLAAVWAAGAAIMACWLLLSNLLFWRKLRSARTPYPVEDCPYDVYLVESGLPSPCLFGLLNPAIYLTPAALASPEALRHVLAHEETHARHGDPLWCLLRGLCLVLYWFDPLVWWAALASRTDCELACDEGALRRLGEDARIPYGRTLLSLIPVKKASPASVLVSATTMTAGKKQLTDRITRIAENRKTVRAALLAVALIAVLVCAVTFTGAKSESAQSDGGGSQNLTEAELDALTKELFEDGGELRSQQFLTSLYDHPQEIDMFQLLYCGTPYPEEITDQEYKQLADVYYGGEDPGVDLTKISKENMVKFFEENTGTPFPASPIGLGNFIYVPEYDAYYHFHGDTNMDPITIVSAAREEGGRIHLIYDGTVLNGREALTDRFRATLLERSEGGYFFLSNELDSTPVPTAYPAWEPVMTIPVPAQEPYRAPDTVIQHYKGNLQMNEGILTSAPYSVAALLGEDGRAYFIVQHAALSSISYNYFFSTDDLNYNLSNFHNLFGRDGFSITYTAQLDERYYGRITDFYTLSEDGDPSLFIRAKGDVTRADLDGDGVKELTAFGGDSTWLYFQRGGQIYETELRALLESAWTEAGYMSFGPWDEYTRSMPMNAVVPLIGDHDPAGNTDGDAFRTIYFDGESLRLYRDERLYPDNFAEDIEAPDDVKQAVREQVEGIMNSGGGASGRKLVDGDFVEVPLTLDAWRVSELKGPYNERFNDLQIQIWNMDYQIHTDTPEYVMMAGGRYLTEDGWFSAGYPGCDYLMFRLNDDGTRDFLYREMHNDCSPGTDAFRTALFYELEAHGLQSLETQDGPTLLTLLSAHPVTFLNDAAQRPAAVQQKIQQTLGKYLAQNNASDPENKYSDTINYLRTFSSEVTPEGRAFWDQLQDVILNNLP